MGNEDSRLVDEGGGEFDPRKNYDKRTSRKHHRQDFMGAIRTWRARKEAELGPNGTLLTQRSSSPASAAQKQHLNHHQRPHRNRHHQHQNHHLDLHLDDLDDETNYQTRNYQEQKHARSRQNASNSPERRRSGQHPQRQHQRYHSPRRRNQRNSTRRRNSSMSSTASPPPPSSPNQGLRNMRTTSDDSQPPPPPPPPPSSPPPKSPLHLKEDEMRMVDWFEMMCTRDAQRGAAFLEHLQKTHRRISRQHSATPKGFRSKHTAQSLSVEVPPKASPVTPVRLNFAAMQPHRRQRDQQETTLTSQSGAGRRKHSDVVTSAATRALSPKQASKRLQVFLRKRPMFNKEIDQDFDVVDATGALQPNAVVIFDTRMKADMRGMKMTPQVFSFDRVFDEFTSNAQVYRETTIGLVQHALAGKLASAFVFGQTGSGKTYTMTAILTLAAQTIFHVLGSANRAQVYLTMYELYGTQCRDLLAPRASDAGLYPYETHDHSQEYPSAETLLDPEESYTGNPSAGVANESNAGSAVRMLEDGDGSLRLPGLTTKPVYSQEELLECIELGQLARATCETGVHDRSSRSHAFCQINIKYEDRDGQLMLVDLAGSERNKDSLHHDARLAREGAEINKSLMVLKDCFRAQAEGKAFVPFRASMLTRILKSALTDPEGKTSIIATVSPSSGDTEHSLSTLTNVSVMMGESRGEQKPQHFKLPVEDVASQSVLKANRAYNEAKAADPRKWSVEKVREWWASKAPAHIAPPPAMDGAMLAKWSQSRFTQYCRETCARARKQAEAESGAGKTNSAFVPESGQDSSSPNPTVDQARSRATTPTRTKTSNTAPTKQSAKSSSTTNSASTRGILTVDANAVGDDLYNNFREMISNLRKQQQLRVQAKVGRR